MVLGQKHVSFSLRRAWVKCCLPMLRCVPLGVRHWSVKWYLKSVRRAAHSQGAATNHSGTVLWERLPPVLSTLPTFPDPCM